MSIRIENGVCKHGRCEDCQGGGYLRYEAIPRLYGRPWSELLYLSIAGAFESQIDPFGEEPPEGGWVIEEHTVQHPRSHMPSNERLREWVLDWAGDSGLLTEDGHESFADASDNPMVVEAFEKALDLWASLVPYRVADKVVDTHRITLDENGDPLLNGEPMYVRSEEEE